MSEKRRKEPKKGDPGDQVELLPLDSLGAPEAAPPAPDGVETGGGVATGPGAVVEAERAERAGTPAAPPPPSTSPEAPASPPEPGSAESGSAGTESGEAECAESGSGSASESESGSESESAPALTGELDSAVQSDSAEPPAGTASGAGGTRDVRTAPGAGPASAPGAPDAKVAPDSAAASDSGTVPDPGMAPEPSGDTSSGPHPPAGEKLARARELAELGKVEAAAAVYGQIISENPHHLKAHNNLGVLYDEAGWHDRALVHFDAARAIDPDHPELLMNTGAALAALGRYEEAEQELRRALRIDGENLDVRANLGILFLRRSMNQKAEAELRRVCERDPGHGTAHYYRAEALNRMGRVDDALQVLERAAELQPDNPRIFYMMGLILDRKNLPVEASLMYRRSKEVEASR